MTEILPIKKRTCPDAFEQYSRARFKRTVQLTEQAIAQLEAKSQRVTLASVCEATRAFDDKGKGLQPITILRNPQAAELFRQHSPAYQVRQQRAKKAKRKRSRVTADVCATYHGLRSSDLIQMVEELKAQITVLKAKQEKLENERDEAYQSRDEALQQNTRQLAALTKLIPPAQPAGEKP